MYMVFFIIYIFVSNNLPLYLKATSKKKEGVNSLPILSFY